ncbi:hypothetical protein E2562_000423 [Oryza meyeriana var. granulata]|uniref:Uncharacterized protein n=1 Tax=Oryza meyeriana var. granulata TaxID=110450 RepID=A0A6G1CCH2_9ORYZ|nr:hypothetical protein E2562_000423 [Oryza meyeriana var. granulata]
MAAAAAGCRSQKPYRTGDPGGEGGSPLELERSALTSTLLLCCLVVLEPDLNLFKLRFLLLQELHQNCHLVHGSRVVKTKEHDPSPYLEEDPRGDELPVTLPEKDSESAALPHLVQDYNAQRSSGQRQQQKEHIGKLLAGTGYSRALWPELGAYLVRANVKKELELQLLSWVWEL